MRSSSLALAVGVVLAPLLAFLGGALLPGSYEVTRRVTCDAPPADVHLVLEDFHRWPAWSSELAGAARVEHRGAAAGVDARVSWSGTAGAGGLEIRSSLPARGVWIDRRAAGRPVAKVVVLHEPLAGGKTSLAWTERGRLGGGPLARYAGPWTRRRAAGRIERDLERLRRLVAPDAPDDAIGNAIR